MRVRLNILADRIAARLKPALAVGLVSALLGACSSATGLIPPSEQPLTAETVSLLGKKGMNTAAPIFVRIFKEESELEVWKMRDDGRFYHFKTYPICNWSGDLGPKQVQGDKQAPEGFYTISQTQMNPNSKFYLAFNLGYPNAYDRSLGRTGEALMVHGKCKSAGCYAMTDALAEEIYGLARDALRSGQTGFQVHAFPFRMTQEKLDRFKGHKWYAFWKTLKQGYDSFEINRIPPSIAVCEKRYVVDAVAMTDQPIDPAGRCPRFEKPTLQPFAPRPAEWQLATERLTMPGPKTRDATEVAQTTAQSQSLFATTTGSISGSGMPPGASALGYNP
ncbi:murein L,D-transpeptidase family protein [Hyphomicrobium sp. LHD-15]|uniref:murein L,D-transpeptidase family protein n=1 Tax=Hyphomicrobium sp. LHD-15 TaxID=3072142 RepID=UPI00280CA9BF|nr:murein L,D-transpeptidase family protein [Hyphomicrobium sp. LHD-15]MDQ8699928.1 murein L,D-transpeptidase family protein [Hyphomicrobium sp. LHD-15]